MPETAARLTGGVSMEKKSIETYDEAVEYLLNIPKFSKKNTLADTGVFLRCLGNPEKGRNIIHVAGTNGKGSVCTYMDAVLTGMGHRVCRFISPHLVDIRERFLIEGKMVEKEDFLRAFLKVYEKLPGDMYAEAGYHPSFFEYLFFMAMVLFSQTDCDYWILETGLGGRLDATNAVTKKSLTVITHMGLDHTEYLGDTIVKIAGEKAGIFKKDVPAVCWETSPSVREVLTKCAENVQNPAFFVSKCDYEFLKKDNKSIDFSFHSLYYNSVRLCVHTEAAYQMENVTLALRALEVLLGQELTPESMQKGVAKAVWEGRMEEVLPGIFADGAHNPDGIRAFLESAAGDGAAQRYLFFGVVKDKDYTEMVKELTESRLFTEISVVQIQSGRALSAQSIAETFRTYTERNIGEYHSVEEALEAAKKLTGEHTKVYFAGSLYLVGEIKALL